MKTKINNLLVSLQSLHQKSLIHHDVNFRHSNCFNYRSTDRLYTFLYQQLPLSILFSGKMAGYFCTDWHYFSM